MTKVAEKVLAEALTLDTRERADVAAKLIASLDGEPDEEVERRIQDIEAGRVELVPWRDVERRIQKEILKR